MDVHAIEKLKLGLKIVEAVDPEVSVDVQVRWRFRDGAYPKVFAESVGSLAVLAPYAVVAYPTAVLSISLVIKTVDLITLLLHPNLIIIFIDLINLLICLGVHSKCARLCNGLPNKRDGLLEPF